MNFKQLNILNEIEIEYDNIISSPNYIACPWYIYCAGGYYAISYYGSCSGGGYGGYTCYMCYDYVCSERCGTRCSITGG